MFRFIYFVYYIKNLDWNSFRKFSSYLLETTKVSPLGLCLAIYRDSLRYNISILEYFQFGFRDLTDKEKLTWAGTGYMYEFQKEMNPIGSREILDDKTLFYKKYKKYFMHHALAKEEILSNSETVKEMLSFPKIVLKESNGKCGLGTFFLETENLDADKLYQIMKAEGYDLAESYIMQHHDLNRLSPSGVNTVRIITQLNVNNEVVILGCRQRISIDSPIDNLAAGNIAAPIDEQTGLITGPGVYSDITKRSEAVHPVTKTEITGFQVPFWKKCVELAISAAKEFPENRSIGWDIVVTENGPGLIEGNHDWCKLVWQLPVNKGLKSVLVQHMKECN
jgi:hypothetical protein